MYSKLLIIVIALAVSTFAQESTRPPVAVGPGCTAAVSITKRAGSDYVDGQGRTNSIYDISATNVGSCDIYDLGVSISSPSGSEIVQTWNLQPEAVATLIVGFGPFLGVGQTFTGSGLIIAFADSSSAVVDLTVYGTNCPADCVNQGSSTTGSASGSGSTTGSTTGSVSTTGSGSEFTGCPATVNTVLRTTYVSGDSTNYVYDIQITNLTPYPLSSVDITYAIENRTVTQQWNLQTTCCTQIESVISFSVNVFNLAAGGVFDGAGFIQTIPTGAQYQQPIADVLNPSKNLFCSVSDN